VKRLSKTIFKIRAFQSRFS